MTSPAHPRLAGSDAEGPRARLLDYCRRLLRDSERAEAVCAQVIADASSIDLEASCRLADGLRRIADRRCHEAIDAEVRRLLAAGDRRAAETELYEAYGVRILGFCHRLLRDPQLAEDVAQQVVLEACRDLDRYAGRGSLYGWLCGIARNRCVDAIRRRRPESEPAADPPDGTAWPVDELLDRRRIYAAILECMALLSPRSRHVVEVRFAAADASYEDLALVLGEKSATLNRRVTRAMKDLRTCLERKGFA